MNRREELAKWLEKVRARELATVPGPQKSVMTFYGIKGNVFIIQRHHSRTEGDFSWEMYAPVSRSSEVAKTFADAEKYLALSEVGC